HKFVTEEQMAQVPPPPPPGAGGAPPPMGSGAVGSNKKTYTIIAYAFICAPWIGGLIMMFVGKDDPDVKWNGANSTIIFGGLFVITLVLSVIGIGIIFSVVSLILWIYYIIKAVT